MVGDKDCTIILGVWIYSPQDLISCHRQCMMSNKLHFKLTKKALERNKCTTFYMGDENDKRIKEAIDKQTKSEYTSHI